MMSEVFVSPVYAISCAFMTLTGLSLVSVGDGIREPVTSIFSIFWVWAVSMLAGAGGVVDCCA